MAPMLTPVELQDRSETDTEMDPKVKAPGTPPLNDLPTPPERFLEASWPQVGSRMPPKMPPKSRPPPIQKMYKNQRISYIFGVPGVPKSTRKQPEIEDDSTSSLGHRHG